MARNVTTQRKIITTVAAWTIGLIIFFPIYWTILTSLKTEAQAIHDPPLFFAFNWTLENYVIVQERSDYLKFLWNSVVIAGGSTGCVVHGVCAVSTDQRHSALDAVHQNAACGGRTLSNFSGLCSVQST